MNFLNRLRKLLPTPQEIEQYRYLHIFGDSLKQRELWTFNRTSTAKGIAIGIFCAFLPMPFEMVPAIFLAIYLRGNLPFAVGGVWLSNPVTWIPLYTPPYLLGAKILNIEPIAVTKISILDLGWHYVALWLGCLIFGIIAAIAAHFTVSILWRSQIRQRWARRRELRRNRKKKAARTTKGASDSV